MLAACYDDGARVDDVCTVCVLQEPGHVSQRRVAAVRELQPARPLRRRHGPRYRLRRHRIKGQYSFCACHIDTKVLKWSCISQVPCVSFYIVTYVYMYM